ncbi:MAG: 50S ribosomal protein L25/general stress protein Ctc [Chloroflexi bacterium]|nr:MAG: 50S ribosomal protein L25/general stress protein Ctc [Chloroflexota bacterium]
MSQKIELEAELRTDVGKGASRRLRRLADKVPSIMYGGDQDSIALTLRYNELAKAMQEESFFSQIISIKTNGKSQQVVVRDLQRHPASDRVQHIDFLRIRADRALQVQVPIHFINEEECVGVRTEGGAISHMITDVEISCLPGDLPSFLEVDMLEVTLGTALHVSDIIVPEGVTIVALAQEEPNDAQIATVLVPRENIEEEPELEALEGEEGEEGEAVEGEEAAEEGGEGDEDSAEQGKGSRDDET